jgi:hypothetical protein
MATIQQVGQQRKDYIRKLQAITRTLDTQIEGLQREYRRILNKKKGFPELENLATIIQWANKSNAALKLLSDELMRGYPQ